MTRTRTSPASPGCSRATSVNGVPTTCDPTSPCAAPARSARRPASTRRLPRSCGTARAAERHLEAIRTVRLDGRGGNDLLAAHEAHARSGRIRREPAREVHDMPERRCAGRAQRQRCHGRAGCCRGRRSDEDTEHDGRPHGEDIVARLDKLHRDTSATVLNRQWMTMQEHALGLRPQPGEPDAEDRERGEAVDEPVYEPERHADDEYGDDLAEPREQ